MTGLKSGSGDDLWDDDEDQTEADRDAGEPDSPPSTPRSDDQQRRGPDTSSEDADDSVVDSGAPSESDGTSRSGTDPSSGGQPYIVRRAVQDKSVQFERDERLTFFVRDDVAEGERDLITDLQATLGRDVPKFDVREAVYRAALENPDDVLEELLEMGYSVDEA